VLELLHGTPGGPDSWVSLGQARATLDAFAARHGGRGPIVVMPDINGSHRADSECITTPGGADVERYLTVDVPNWVSAQYPGTAGRRWGVAGLSEGGMCAVMLALRHPGRYAVFGDFSGLGRPTTGSRDDPATTLRVLFHGSRTAYDQHDPGWLLQHNRYPTLSGWFEYGLSDVEARDATRRLAAQAQAAGVTVRELAASGRHSWTIWTSALQTLLPWMWEKL
jgi:S-formylglutathione hydrolase FrmB